MDRYASFAAQESDIPDLKGLDLGVKLSSIWVRKHVIANPGPFADFVGGPRPYAKLSLNAKAVSVLSPLIDGVCELVPYTYKQWKYWALHVTTPSDCLDFERTEYRTTNRAPYNIRQPVFAPDRIPKDQHIFRLPGGIAHYVTDRFKRTVQDAGLTGLTFRFVWSSDGSTPPPDEPVTLTSSASKGPQIRRRRTKRDKILERLWEAIDRFGGSEWLAEILATPPQRLEGAQDVVVAGPKVLAEALATGISSESISRLCRSIAYYAMFEALVAIEEEGLDKSAALASLHESLLMADPKK